MTTDLDDQMTADYESGPSFAWDLLDCLADKVAMDGIESLPDELRQQLTAWFRQTDVYGSAVSDRIDTAIAQAPIDEMIERADRQRKGED